MKIVIAGAGEVGSHLAKMLSNESNEITVIDMDNDRLEALRTNTDVITVEGNPSAIKVLQEAGVATADLFIAVNPSESQDVNIVSAMLAKKLGSKKATARINNEEYLSYENKYLFTEMGIDLMFYPEKIAAGEIIDLLRRTASSDSMDFARGKLQVGVFKLEEDSPLIGLNMMEFSKIAAEEGIQSYCSCGMSSALGLFADREGVKLKLGTEPIDEGGFSRAVIPDYRTFFTAHEGKIRLFQQDFFACG